MRVTLDTNVYVSALEFAGKPMRLLQMGLEGDLEIAVSEPILNEPRHRSLRTGLA